MDPILSIVEQEYHSFKEWIMLHKPEQIWELSSRITFYQDVYEYFNYTRSYPTNLSNIPFHHKPFIQSLWLLHLKSDIYHGSRWDEILFLIEQLIESSHKQIA